MLDTLIVNGWIADGTGNPTYPAQVGIQGDRIVESAGIATAGVLERRHVTHLEPVANSTFKSLVTEQVGNGNCRLQNSCPCQLLHGALAYQPAKFKVAHSFSPGHDCCAFWVIFYKLLPHT